MDSPNRTANSIIGAKDSMGPGAVPSRSANQPHWNTATTTP